MHNYIFYNARQVKKSSILAFGYILASANKILQVSIKSNSIYKLNSIVASYYDKIQPQTAVERRFRHVSQKHLGQRLHLRFPMCFYSKQTFKTSKKVALFARRVPHMHTFSRSTMKDQSNNRKKSVPYVVTKKENCFGVLKSILHTKFQHGRRHFGVHWLS